MEAYAVQNRLSLLQFMAPFSTKLHPPFLRLAYATSAGTSKLFSAATLALTTTEAPSPLENSVILTGEQPPPPIRRSNRRKKDNDVVLNAQLRENWLESLCCPFPPQETKILSSDLNGVANAASEWVMGIDPDISGAVALLKPDDSVQVFDSPHLKVPVGGRTRKRLDAKSIVQLLHSFDAPMGTIAYLEQSIPYPKDGKQGWWSGGFGYGLWIGVLVASGFSVVPVPSFVWKNEFKLSGKGLGKNDSREAACKMFPSMSSLLKRKKDHGKGSGVGGCLCYLLGCSSITANRPLPSCKILAQWTTYIKQTCVPLEGRAEALLIAAYGKGLKLD